MARVLSGDPHPDHDSIASFRQRHLGHLGGLFAQVLVLCQKAGLVELGHVAIDGTATSRALLKFGGGSNDFYATARACASTLFESFEVCASRAAMSFFKS